MTDLNTLSKADLNARLATPLAASALKKMPKPELVALVAAQEKPKTARKPSPQPSPIQRSKPVSFT